MQSFTLGVVDRNTLILDRNDGDNRRTGQRGLDDLIVTCVTQAITCLCAIREAIRSQDNQDCTGKVSCARQCRYAEHFKRPTAGVFGKAPDDPALIYIIFMPISRFSHVMPAAMARNHQILPETRL
jgi:hypothetical protein